MGLVLVGAGLERWEDVYAWPVDASWYRVTEQAGSDGRTMIEFGCQNFAPVEFAEVPDRPRIFVVGGSTTFGFPERPVGTEPLRGSPYGVVGALEAALSPGVEVVNLGVNGGTSEDTLRLVRRAMAWGPSGIVVYDGSNEVMAVPQHFSAGLWRFALYRRFAGLAPRATESPGWVGPASYGDDAHFSAVVSQFRHNLDATVALARAAGVPIVLATQARNLVDFDPSWSTEGPTGSLATASDAEVEAALAAAPRSAEAAFEAGRRRRATGGDARAAFIAAVDEDGMPFRVSTAINGAILHAGALGDARVVVADAEAAVGALPGDDEFYDWIHPRPAAAEKIAAAILVGMRESGMISGAVGAPVHAFVPDAAVDLREAASWLQWACVRRQDPAHRLAEADRWALAAMPGPEADAMHGIIDVLAGRAEHVLIADPALAERLGHIHACVARALAPTP